MQAGSTAAELLTPAAGADEAELEGALEAVHAAGRPAIDSFCRAFGPRRLMRRLLTAESSRLLELSDSLLALCLDGEPGEAGCGLTGSADFANFVHREDVYPDTVVEVHRPIVGMPSPQALLHSHTAGERLSLRRFGGDFVVDSCACSPDAPPPPADGSAPAAAAPAAEGLAAEGLAAPEAAASLTLRLRNPSRRERFGHELACKIWPAAEILGRWLWSHPWIVDGRTVLELGVLPNSPFFPYVATPFLPTFLPPFLPPFLPSVQKECVFCSS